MARNYGPNPSRVLDPTGRQWLDVLWAQGKCPLDSELNLLQDIAANWQQQFVSRNTPSGWLGNGTNDSESFVTNPQWSNWFKLGRQRVGEQSSIEWAVVNSWLIPVTGTRTGALPGSPDNADTWNVIALNPPPSNAGVFRVDFVYLEVWLARVPPNPSSLNKPGASTIYTYGNVEGGMSYLADDIQDPSIGAETTERVQLQYRIGVASGLVGLTTNPDGFDPAVVFARGASSSATTYNFVNMRSALGDPGLWRAGDGSLTAQTALGTVDGYSYAIPISGVFRRNSSAWSGDASPNLNGAFNRNILAVDRTGIATYSTTPTLATPLSTSATIITLASIANIPLPISPVTPVVIQIGDEQMTYTGITGTTVSGLVRGYNNTRAEQHAAGSAITLVSGRPDGLYADQVAKTDILDLRHVVNPNGFDFDTLLKYNFDRLVRGQLRSNWKRTNAGPQGPFVLYQDKIVSPGGSVALGVSRLDSPDNIREIFSDAAVPQPVQLILAPVASVPSNASVSWDLELTVTQIFQNGGPNNISPGDIFVVPIAQFQGTLNGDTDQVRFINDGLSSAVTIRIDGQTDPLPDTSSYYVVMPTHPEAGDDLIITLGPNFPTISSAPPNLYIEVHIQYGPGRGVARRPDSVHGVTFETAPTGFLYHPSGTPSNNFPMHVGWSALRSSFRNEMFKGLVPVTTEAYADPGSKTLILTPFRQIGMPANFLTMDGTAANLTSGSYTTLTKGATTGTMTFTDTTDAPFTTGMAMTTAIVVTNGPQPGRYTIVSYSNTGQVTLDRAIPTATELNFTIEPAQGLMPLNDQFGNAKWTQTDPLQLFASCTTNSSNSLADKNLYVQLPRELVPAWGEYHVPIVVNATYAPAGFSEGVNYMLMSSNGTATGGNTNYLPYVSTGVGGSSSTYQTFSTLDLTTSGSIAYNTALTYGGLTYAGMQQFNDVNGPRARGLGRQGLELPPFYGVARLFAVYEASDYTAHGSAYSAMTRIPTGGGATNLLRQNMGQNDGPTFWVEIDNDRDSTFILNANAIDITRAPTPISSFSAGNYVIEATIFGFDRGFFDITHEARLVLSASRPPNQATGTTRASNIGIPIIGPNTILPGPLSDGISVLATYSRTPYMGDAWGSQTGYTDITPTTGPLLTSAAYQISSTTLTPTALTRPNQKLLEVVASIGFVTTLGTGCAVGDHATPPEYSLRNIGYEDPTEYPPTTIGQDRPTTKAADFMGDSVSPPVGSEYLGCTERLPLGALFRDKDFRGESFGGFIPAPFMFTADGGTGLLGGLAVSSSYEQSEALVQGVGLAAGQPGNFLVAVDGNQTNYTQLTNYRVNRGGSVFNASGHYPGGEVASIVSSLTSPTGHTNVLCGRAFLVRNTVTNVNASEVSAGDELMMLVVTSVVRLTDTNPSIGQVIIGTNGSFEGYSAADLYRCEGHPLLNDNVRNDLDPSTIPLAPRAF